MASKWQGGIQLCTVLFQSMILFLNHVVPIMCVFEYKKKISQLLLNKCLVSQEEKSKMQRSLSGQNNDTIETRRSLYFQGLRQYVQPETLASYPLDDKKHGESFGPITLFCKQETKIHKC